MKSTKHENGYVCRVRQMTFERRRKFMSTQIDFTKSSLVQIIAGCSLESRDLRYDTYIANTNKFNTALHDSFAIIPYESKHVLKIQI